MALSSSRSPIPQLSPEQEHQQLKQQINEIRERPGVAALADIYAVCHPSLQGSVEYVDRPRDVDEYTAEISKALFPDPPTDNQALSEGFSQLNRKGLVSTGRENRIRADLRAETTPAQLVVRLRQRLADLRALDPKRSGGGTATTTIGLPHLPVNLHFFGEYPRREPYPYITVTVELDDPKLVELKAPKTWQDDLRARVNALQSNINEYMRSERAFSRSW